MKKLFLILTCFLFVIPVKAANLATNAKSAMIVEASTGEIIFSKNINEKLEPASLTKMMSMLIVLESIDKGIIKWDDVVIASKNASSMGGSQILLEENEKMTVRDLFKGVAIASGNDAVVALAEKIAGTVENFVSLMDKRGKELGLTNTNFKNPHGLTSDGHYTTANDLALIALELVKHEDVFKYTSVYEDYLRANTSRKLWLVNTNKLVRFYDGVDGLKTGYTNTAGYCLVATAKKNNMRIIAIVLDEPTSDVRNKEVTEMLNYAFSQYELGIAIDEGTVLKNVKVEKGVVDNIDVIASRKVTYLKNKLDNDPTVKYDVNINKLVAPLKKGDVVGKVKVQINNNYEMLDITVKEDVERITFFELFLQKLAILLT